jgi:hypothetical protein
MRPTHRQRSGLCLRGPYMSDEAKNCRFVPLAMVIYGFLACIDGRDEGM